MKDMFVSAGCHRGSLRDLRILGPGERSPSSSSSSSSSSSENHHDRQIISASHPESLKNEFSNQWAP